SAKHFAVNSIEDTRLVVDVSIDERALREVYLPHFRMAVEQGHVGSVMAAYNKVNGRFNAENFHLLRDILKGEWRVRGVVRARRVRGVRWVRPHPRSRQLGQGRPRYRDAGGGVLRRAARIRGGGGRRGAALGDRRRRAPRAAREVLLPARQRPAGSRSEPDRDPRPPRSRARRGPRRDRAAAQQWRGAAARSLPPHVPRGGGGPGERREPGRPRQ